MPKNTLEIKQPINSITYADTNRSGVVVAVSCNSFDCNIPTPSGLVYSGYSNETGMAQIVKRIGDHDVIYPTFSVSPSTSLEIDYSTSSIKIDDNADGVVDKIILPIVQGSYQTIER